MKKILHTVFQAFSLLRTTVHSAYHYSKASTRALFGIFLFLAVCGTLFFFQTLLVRQSEHIPRSGGVLTEGLIGSPVSVDPLSAVSETEQALSYVFFSGINSLAQQIQWNDTHTTATVTLKEKTRFHDGKPLTADDVLFTYEKAKNSTNQTPLFYEALSNTTIQAQGPLLVVFTSSKEIPLSFFELGIIPKHIWEKEVVTEKESLVGSGPFFATRIVIKKGTIEKITTHRFPHYSKGKPFLKKIHFVFYENTDTLMRAITNGEVGGATVEANELPHPIKYFSILPTDSAVALYALPSYDGLFTGGRVSVLEQMIDKNQILAIVRNSYGSISGSHTPSSEFLSEESKKLLQQKGVVFTQEGAVAQAPTTTLFLRDDPELIATAQLLQNYYGILGLPVELKIFSRGVFREEIEKNQAALVLGYTTDTVVPSQKLLFSLFSLGVGRYAHYEYANPETQPFDVQKRYTDIHTWSLRKELQWKKNN